MEFLFVCLGNICRSPIAEGILQQIINHENLDWKVDSAGTSNYHVHNSPHQDSQNVCQKYGIDISMQRARQIVAKDLDKYDVILALDQSVLSDIRQTFVHHKNVEKVKLITDFNPELGIKDIPDPYYGGVQDFEKVYQLLDDLCHEIYHYYK